MEPGNPDTELFGQLVASAPRGARPRRGLGLVPVSIGLHAVVLLLVLLIPLLGAESLPTPAVGVRAFLVDAPAPAPPPAPSRARRAAARIKPKPPEVTEAPKFAAPIEVPEEIVPEVGLGLDVGFGVEGGVEGGIAGGVVGGVVGGLAEAPPPPAAVRVGGNVQEPRKLKNVSPVYPDMALQARVQGVVILECLVDVSGRVTDVKVLRGVPMLDQAAIDAVKQWVYGPTLIDGVPTPVIMTVTVRFDLKGRRSAHRSRRRCRLQARSRSPRPRRRRSVPRSPASPPGAGAGGDSAPRDRGRSAPGVAAGADVAPPARGSP
jgi:protein TonB